MRFILGVSFILFAQISNAQLPVGRWLNPQLTQDDGAFGKYYKGWLIVSDDRSIDQIITMGMHFDKTKLQILSDNGKTVRVFDKNENVETDIAYEVTGNNLKMCPLPGACTTYQRTNGKPVTESAPATYPQIQISTKWCVDKDCESIVFDGIASEMLYNLNEGFKPVFWQYAAPEILFARHGIRLQVLTYSYRFSNNGLDLSSFMTSLVLMIQQGNSSDFIARSGALVLREGPLSQLHSTYQGHEISLDFSLAKQTLKAPKLAPVLHF